ncbi:hypothetical protein WN51_07544 [Melipona quadrifasciata]|uniref:Uncharacterized protein n=1 Tax=Melipona quadrifasciata TaxID=166423 RepID=A0A0M9A9H6_9HYME|nr:hypothetical protein WN51_07544 [Melipona quadrifasciata]
MSKTSRKLRWIAYFYADFRKYMRSIKYPRRMNFVNMSLSCNLSREANGLLNREQGPPFWFLSSADLRLRGVTQPLA